METKTCNKCGEVKSLDEFYKNKSIKDGYNCSCRECSKIYRKKYRQSEKYKEYQKKYEISRKKERNEYFAIYKNSYKRKEAIDRYCIKNKDKIKERSKKYYIENKEKLKKYRKNYFNDGRFDISKTKHLLKKEIGCVPPKELIEVKLLILKTKKLCKTSNNLEPV